jgi:hypothetical protein
MDALTDRERAALIATLRELNALDRLNEVARDFAQRGVHALLGKRRLKSTLRAG